MALKRGLHQPTPFDPNIPEILEHDRLYSIEVGSKVFRLSGASLSSDSPSYFTHYFAQFEHLADEERPVLVIDRSPKVFEYICLHLQGYHVQPDDDQMLAYLILEASYYNLKKLRELLRQADFLIRVGGELFRLPQDLFRGPGDMPNFITVQFYSLLEAPHDLEFRKSLVRPVPAAPMKVADHSPQLFRDLITAMSTSHVEVDSECHRQQLIKEAKFYRFRGLEQKLVATRIQFNSFRSVEEIIIPVQYVAASGLVIACPQGRQSLHYKRPYIDNVQRELIIQFDSEEVTLSPNPDVSSAESPSHILLVPPGQVLSSLRSVWHQTNSLLGHNVTNKIEQFPVTAISLSLFESDQVVLHKSLWRICVESPCGPCLELLKCDKKYHSEHDRWADMPFTS